MFAELVDNAIDLVWPRYCLGCGASGRGICANCSDVRPAVRFVPGLGPVHAAASYGGAVRAAIIHYKDRRRRDLRAPLTALLSAAVGAARADTTEVPAGALMSGARGAKMAFVAGPVLVPVPSTTRAARERGGDHMRRLAASVARRQRLRADALLRVGRPVQDATGLGAAARTANITGAYVCRGVAPARAGPVILVDDVITTGASLREATRCLTAAGYRVQAFAVIALVPPGRRARVNQWDPTR
jgi:predicted amidophosphoribosyltransferase